MKRAVAGLAVAAGLALAPPASAADWRTSAGGTVDGLAVIDTGGGPAELPAADASLRLDAASSQVAARLQLRGRIGGPFVGGSGAGVYEFGDTFQNQSPALEFPEAWIETRSRRVEVRAGLQRFAWGKLDGLPPTDVLNPRDYHDPLVEDFEDRKIGVPALSGTWYPSVAAIPDLHDLKLNLTWLPFAVPPRLALARERWFSHSIEPPRGLTLSPSLLRQIHACAPNAPTCDPLPITPIVIQTRNDGPARQLDEGGVALRLGGTWRETDWDVYHYTGPETAPLVAFRPELFLPSDGPLAGSAKHVYAVSQLVQEQRRIHMTGADFATTLGGFTVRGEMAWFLDRPYLRVANDLLSPDALSRLHGGRLIAKLRDRGHVRVNLGELFPTHDSIEWGLGADYLWHGWLPLLQVNQVAFLDDPRERLLVDDPETRVTGSLKKRFFDDRVDLELRSVVGIARGWWFVFPRLGYRVRDDLHVRVGYLAIGGPRPSYLGQFKSNDEVTFQVQYTY